MKKIAIAAIAAASFVALHTMSANAEEPAFFNAPMQFAGTGCGAGAASVSGEGTDTLTVLFSKYDAAKPSDKAASKMERTACSFVIPVKVPKGIQVSVLTADWRGFAEGETELFREYFFAGTQGPQKTTSPSGNYTEHDDLMHTIWSDCKGGTIPMRINSSVRAVDNPSYIGADSLDMKNKIIFKLKWRQCR